MKTLAEAIAAIETLTKRVADLESNGPKQRGPKIARAMTEEDAFRVKFGDLKKPMSHKEAASQTGLSYGQVFSCRGGYTFKHVRANWTKSADDTVEGAK